MNQKLNLEEPVLPHLSTDFPVLRHDLTVQQALDAIRQQQPGEGIIYFYVVDEQQRLCGVLPTRRLLTAPLDQPITAIAVQRVVTIPHTATVLEACEYFVLYKLLAFPVVDDERRLLGLVNIGLFTDEVFNIAERGRVEDVFEAIGFRLSQVRDASPWQAFRVRFPWLMATMTSGVLCALVASAFETTLAKSVVLTFFLALVLALCESVSFQSVALAIQSLRAGRPTLSGFLSACRRETFIALLLGLASGLLAFLIVWLWRGTLGAAAVIGLTVLFAFCTACLFGLAVPTVLHALKLDPKIAAGPVTLALTDITALLFYFTLATLLL